MIFREAQLEDIRPMMFVRGSVKENILNNPELVTYADYDNYLSRYGKGWVCELNKEIIGFAIIGLIQNNVWALFVLPEYQAKGIGRKLQNTMLNWYFTRTTEKIWLSTAPHTQAEKFYIRSGWKPAGMTGGEIKFEMSFDNWLEAKTNMPGNT